LGSRVVSLWRRADVQDMMMIDDDDTPNFA
jgi:hypothetical protein